MSRALIVIEMPGLAPPPDEFAATIEAIVHVLPPGVRITGAVDGLALAVLAALGGAV